MHADRLMHVGIVRIHKKGLRMVARVRILSDRVLTIDEHMRDRRVLANSVSGIYAVTDVVHIYAR